jgi:hypothetical protein
MKPTLSGASAGASVYLRPTLVPVRIYGLYISKSCIFLDITPCSPLKVNQHFGEHAISIFRVEEKAKKEGNIKRVAQQAHLIYRNISQKRELFIITAVRAAILHVNFEDWKREITETSNKNFKIKYVTKVK